MNLTKMTVGGFLPDDSLTGTFILTLNESQGPRRLSFPIGMAEAQDITLGVEKITTRRPMLHDLVLQFLSRFNLSICAVRITERRDDTYFAQIVIHSQQGDETFDARPSDAIALAVRLNLPIEAAIELLD